MCVYLCWFGEKAKQPNGPLSHLPDRLVAMLLLELGELRLLRRDFLGQHALEGGQRPLAPSEVAEDAL